MNFGKVNFFNSIYDVTVKWFCKMNLLAMFIIFVCVVYGMLILAAKRSKKVNKMVQYGNPFLGLAI